MGLGNGSVVTIQVQYAGVRGFLLVVPILNPNLKGGQCVVL